MVSAQDRDVLRRLGSQVAEIAALPVQKEKIRLWKALNSLKPIRPMVMIDQMPWHEMDVDGELKLQCTDPFCKDLETQLRRTLYRWKHMPADFVVMPFVEVSKVIRNSGWGIERHEQISVLDPQNDVVGHAFVDQITKDEDIEKIHAPQVDLDAAATAAAEEKAHTIFDGVIDVRMQGMLPWVSGWDIITQLRNPEALLWDLADRPEFMHRLIKRVMDAAMGMLDQLEAKGLLGSDMTWIHCTGAFTDELPKPGFDPAKPRAKDIWTFGMAQIFSTVSPATHDEFEIAYNIPWFKRFGIVYYGCCEPVDDRIHVIRKLPNVRKISMSPWVNQDRGAREIGRDYVFSPKPSPAFLAPDTFNPKAVEEDLRQTVQVCGKHGCPLELILKDISTVRYEPKRLWEWEKIAMKAVGA